MAYHAFIPDDSNPGNFIFDCYLGSAITINLYWESIGRKLGLLIISELTERADSEDGFTLFGADLRVFRDEVSVLERYWVAESSVSEIPKDLVDKIENIKFGIDAAIERELKLMVA